MGDLPQDYPSSRLNRGQGLEEVRSHLENEKARSIVAYGITNRAHPSGPIVWYVRHIIIYLCFIRIQFLIDWARDWMAFRVLDRKYRTTEEIATWRDRYQIVRFLYFVIAVLALPHLPWMLKWLVNILTGLYIVDILGGVAGSALVWPQRSLDHERSFLTAITSYAQIVVAFAGFYRMCGCLNITDPDTLQALYFSTVVATTLGFGDVVPRNSTGVDACGHHVPICHVGLLLVISQLVVQVLFLVLFVGIFMGRVPKPPDKGP